MRGDRLKEIREARGLTQPELAERIGIHAQQVYRIESGKSPNPSADTLTAISKELDVSVDYLLGLVDSPTERLREEDLSDMERRLIQAVRTGEINELFEVLGRLSKKKDQAQVAPRQPTVNG